jgi:hypothetical protein
MPDPNPQRPPGIQLDKLRTAIPTRRAVQDMASEDDETSPLRDWIVPIALLAIGVSVRFSQVLFFASKQSLSTPAAVGLLICELIIGTAALIAGAFAAATILNTTFGDLRIASLKVVAIAVFTSAAAYLAASIDREPEGIRGMVLAWHLILIFYFVLFVYLFKLDLQEGIITTIIVMAIQLVILFAISRGLSPEAAKALLFG